MNTTVSNITTTPCANEAKPMKETLAAGKQVQGLSYDDVTDVSNSIELGQDPANETDEPSDASDAPHSDIASTRATDNILAKRKREYPEVLEDWHIEPDISAVADEMAAIFQKHCAMPPDEVHAVVFWIISSYTINAYQIFPKLTLISPEMRCGKSTVLTLVSAMCRDGLQTSNISPATIFRLSKEVQPTLLLDEADTFVKNASPDLIGIINSGHNQSTAYVFRCEGDSHEPRAHSTWMPMVLASIGDLAPTIMDRSIVINLRRAKATERVERIPVGIMENLKPLRRQLYTWAKGNFAIAKETPVEPPGIGNDRAADNWAPLFTTASLASATWQERVDKAYKCLNALSEPALPTLLLRDIKCIFDQTKEDRISSIDLLQQLCADPESPWSTLNSGKRITANNIATYLRPYGISPRTAREGDKTRRGYERHQFHDAFARYL